MATTSVESLVAFGEKHVTKGLPKLTQDVFDKGEGSWVTMKSGKKLLDFTCGIGVTNLGELFLCGTSYELQLTRPKAIATQKSAKRRRTNASTSCTHRYVHILVDHSTMPNSAHSAV